ncbi:MAG: GAF domain-containing protein [Dehalococcoidia bacterium]|nr:GAF domain-containing protein [Dehalococcoidia bacterium]
MADAILSSELSPKPKPRRGRRPRNSRQDLDQVLSSAVRLAHTLLKGDIAAVALADDEGYLTVRSHVGLSPKCVARWRVHRSVGLNARAFASGKPFFSSDTLADEARDSETVRNLRLRGLMMMPLKLENEVAGWLAVGFRHKREFSAQDMELVGLLADHVSLSIRATAVVERERRQRKRSDALLQVTSAPALSLDVKRVLTKLCQLVLKMTVAERCAIWVFSEEEPTVETIVAMGGKSPVLWERSQENYDIPIPRINGVSSRRVRKPVIEEHAPGSVAAEEGWVNLFDVKSIAQYPLFYRGSTIGVLIAYTFSDFVRFPQEEIDTLAAVARQAAVMIENARLYEQEQRQRKRAEALLEVASSPSLSLSVRKVLIKLCQSVLNFTVAERCSIFLFNEETHTLDPVMSAGTEDPDLWEKFRASAGLKIPEIRGIGEAISAQEPVIEEHVPGSGILPDFWIDTFGLKSLALYPIIHREKTVGILEVDSFSKFVRFPRAEIETLAAIARQAAIIIENARLYEQEQQQRQRTEALLDVLSAAASTLSMKKVLIKVCQSVLKLTVADRCSILLTEEDGVTLRPVMSLGIEDPEMWERFRNPPPGETSPLSPEHRRLQEAITTWEKPIVQEDAAAAGLLSRWWVETFNIKSLAHYPLRVKDRTIGLLTVDSFRQYVHFPKEEIETLAAIARQVAVIIDNARLYEQEQQQRKRAETLVDVLAAAAEDASLKRVLVKICQAVVNLTVGDRCSIFIVDKEGRRLQPMMSLGIEDAEMWEKFRSASPAALRPREEQRRAEDIVTWDKPFVAENALETAGLNRWWVETFKIKSLVRYPLRVKDRTIGMMVVDTVHEHKCFPREEIETIAAIAKQAAIIIENARLHEQLQEQAITDALTGLYNHRHIHERVEEEFERASRNNRPFAVLMMDLDNFKFFNDAHGHQTGDEALRFAGTQIKNSLRAADIVGRYGGDEFLAILPETNRAEAEQAAERIISSLAANPFPVPNSVERVPMDVSIGIACYPVDATNSHDLVALADAAMYEAKRVGGARALPAYAYTTEPVSPHSAGFELLRNLLSALAYKDPYTKRHCEDNVRYTERLAEYLSLEPSERDSLRKAALLHDVGKIAVPDSTLLKPGPLNAEEWQVMRQHVEFGETIVKGISQIADAIEPVATHHERYDGTGYPRGLKGEEIPLLGRILAVVDAYSAMTLDRPYRRALDHEQALAELKKGAGTQFDPHIVEAFLSVIEDMRQARAA